MASRSQILADNNSSFPNNNSAQITPQVLRDYNADLANSVVFNDQTGSMSVANAVSASYALTASFALNGGGGTVDTGSLVTTASFNAFTSSILAEVNALEAATSSYVQNSQTSSMSVATASSTPNALVNAVGGINEITFTKGDGTSFPVVVAVSGSTATASLSLDSERLGGVLPSGYVTTAATSSFATKTELNAYTASTNTFTSSIQTQVNALQAATSSYVTNAQTSSMSVLSASFATTAGFAQTLASGLNITASNILVNNNLTVLGTASFAYTRTTTGSAVMIGDEFIILNADTPFAPFAGIKVYDTGSNSTASLEWNGNGDYWIQVDEAGDSAAMLTGASGSKGSEVFPTTNRLIKGTGNSTVVNSNITDTGTLVTINSNTTLSGSVGISGSLVMNGLSPIQASHVKANDVQGLEVLTNGGATVATFGQGGGTGATFTGQINALAFSGSGALVTGVISSSFATTASFAQNAVSASYAPDTTFPFTGSAGISGSLIINNDLTIVGTSTAPSRFDFETLSTTGSTVSINQYISESGAVTGTIFGSNTIMGTTPTTATASLFLSGSQNYININSLVTNAQAIAGRRGGFNGRRNFILALPSVPTGSNMTMPSIDASWMAGSVNITNNFTSPATISNSFINSTAIWNQTSGSISISNTNLNAQSQITNTWASSSLTAQNSLIVGNVLNATTHTTASDSTSRNLLLASNSILAGTQINTFIKDGTANNGGVVSSIVVSNNMVVTGSAGTTGSAAIFGSFPSVDGRLNDLDQVRFVIGTGTATGARRTSLFVSASGLTVAQDSLLVTGSLTVGTTTPELQVLATGVTLGNVATDAHTVTGSLSISGSLNAPSITGSLLGTASFAVSASWAPTVTINTGSFATTGSNTFTGINKFNAAVSLGNVLSFTGSRFAAVVNNTNDIEALNADSFGINVKDKVLTTSGSQVTVSVTTGSNSTSVALSAQYGGTIGSATLTNTNGARSLSVIVDSTTISGSTTINSLTGSLQGTASFATTASFALNAGGVQASDIYSYSFLLMGA